MNSTVKFLRAVVQAVRASIAIAMGAAWSLFIIDYLLILLFALWLSPVFYRIRRAALFFKAAPVIRKKGYGHGALQNA